MCSRGRRAPAAWVKARCPGGATRAASTRSWPWPADRARRAPRPARRRGRRASSAPHLVPRAGLPRLSPGPRLTAASSATQVGQAAEMRSMWARNRWRPSANASVSPTTQAAQIRARPPLKPNSAPAAMARMPVGMRQTGARGVEGEGGGDEGAGRQWRAAAVVATAATRVREPRDPQQAPVYRPPLPPGAIAHSWLAARSSIQPARSDATMGEAAATRGAARRFAPTQRRRRPRAQPPLTRSARLARPSRARRAALTGAGDLDCHQHGRAAAAVCVHPVHQLAQVLAVGIVICNRQQARGRHDQQGCGRSERARGGWACGARARARGAHAGVQRTGARGCPERKAAAQHMRVGRCAAPLTAQQPAMPQPAQLI